MLYLAHDHHNQARNRAVPNTTSSEGTVTMQKTCELYIINIIMSVEHIRNNDAIRYSQDSQPLIHPRNRKLRLYAELIAEDD